mmetsp:Transcript_25531/g.25917  ORF Transcript_25531/g.25917 Transcript_25531/m.25917 type:complete len:82 (-) Transcript_25531:151-396(-)
MNYKTDHKCVVCLVGTLPALPTRLPAACRPSRHTEHRSAVPASLSAARRSARVCTVCHHRHTPDTKGTTIMGAAGDGGIGQ